MARITRLIQQQRIEFVGAGEQRLVGRVERAWSLEHLDEGQKVMNEEVIRSIASILKEYRTVKCRVHGAASPRATVQRAIRRWYGTDALPA